MADDVNDILVAISFPDAFRATEFMTAASRLVSRHQLTVKDAVFVRKDDDGKVHVRETRDLQAGSTAASTGLWTAFVGLLFGGPIGMIVGGGIGAGAGALAAKVVDLGIPDEWVDWLKEAVQPGQTTLALLVTEFDHQALLTELERFQGAKLLYGNLPADYLVRVREALGEVPARDTSDAAPGDAPASAAAADAPPAGEPLAPPQTPTTDT